MKLSDFRCVLVAAIREIDRIEYAPIASATKVCDKPTHNLAACELEHSDVKCMDSLVDESITRALHEESTHDEPTHDQAAKELTNNERIKLALELLRSK